MLFQTQWNSVYGTLVLIELRVNVVNVKNVKSNLYSQNTIHMGGSGPVKYQVPIR